MSLRRRAVSPALAAGVLIVVGLGGLGLEGCVATAVAGATVGVAGAAVKTAAKVSGKAAGAAVKVTARAAGHALGAGKASGDKPAAQ